MNADIEIRKLFPKQTHTMTRNTRTLFHTIVKRIDAGYKSWKYAQDDIISLGMERKQHSDFVGRSSYDYIPREIRSVIEEHPVHQEVFSFFIEKRRFHVALILPTIDPSDPHEYFQDAIQKIYIWLYVITPVIHSGCSDTMDIHIFFTDKKKKLSKIKREPLGEIHVNTAFTTSCKPSTKVHVYRKEEWFKVFMHETFHNLGLDFSAMNESISNDIILAHFPIQAPGGIRLYESYCEIWAEIFKTVFVSYSSSKHRPSTKVILDKIERMLHEEMLFSTFQCVKILNHYDMTYEQLTNIHCPVSKNARANYKEDSYILSYYIMKCILFSQYNKFIDWCKEHNRVDELGEPMTGMKVIGFMHTQDNVNEYAEFIVKQSQNPVLLQNISHFEKVLLKIPETHELWRSLRMTAPMNVSS